ncbi:hypothetical protein IW140_003746 [Coemansia sp. RSA 1813]|nr:hypothetical protein EV178_003540 [Coemansia sp. RSA 1646]KAJ1772775.1 hypothetical protein LPJ74_001114 [Coemansia sp. RSA 1843]KAJ2088640.1 hypothetical protein IW138_004022 [Coemansia sp. RSA 986]KAJ2211061.1 hypothetical protein EV179_005794 [Coemansia sp. RSA 487]KAJ2568540.1 hypothetical protein IW140_003746 [Coemansia sp. RSA 1813]
MQQTSRQHIHSTYVSHLPPPSRHLVYQPRPSSGLLSASSTVEHHPHGTQPCHNARESSYYICHRGPSTHAESPLTAPAVLYTQSEPSSALPILPEHQHAMTRSHHHPYSQPLGHSTGHDYPHGSNAGLHPTSVHQSHAAVPSSSSAMSGLSAASRSYLTEGRPLTAEEKELKRKVSHSAIEKRRRERTNTVLRELQSIIPGLSKSGKIQKLEILEAAAEYIRDLTTEPKPNDKVETGSSHAGHLGSKKQRRKRMNCSQEYGSALDSLHAPRVLTESTPLETVMEQQQHPAVATPMSVSSNASSDDSSDDALANNLPKPAPDLHSSSPDPSSMKVNFLLCKE